MVAGTLGPIVVVAAATVVARVSGSPLMVCEQRMKPRECDQEVMLEALSKSGCPESLVAPEGKSSL